MCFVFFPGPKLIIWKRLQSSIISRKKRAQQPRMVEDPAYEAVLQFIQMIF